MELEKKFKAYWQSLATDLGLDAKISHDILDYLIAQYSAPNRHYHTVRHIVSMLDGFETIRSKFADPVSAKLAIFFHDAVYNPARKDNEEQSAVVMKEKLGAVIDKKIMEAAAHTIRATKKHKATPNRDTNLVIDLDMAILGQPWAVYERYAAGVMQEYLPVYPEAAYRQGRVMLFLEPTIVGGNHIFLTDEFKHLDAPAVRNMVREKDILSSGKSFSNQTHL